MSSENFNVLEELKSLDEQVSAVGDLTGLKPIFYRLDEIAKQYSDDFEVQLAVGDVKQHLVSRGAKLKAERDQALGVPVLPTTITLAAVPPPPPLPSSGEATLIAPPQSLPPQWPGPFGASPGGPPPLDDAAMLPTAPMAVPPVPPAPSDISWVNLEPSAPIMAESVPPGVPPGIPPAGPPDPSAAGMPGGGAGSVPPPSMRPPVDWKRAMSVGAIGGAVIAIALLAVVVNVARKRNATPVVEATEVAVDVVTTPPGASVRVNSENKCTSDCKFSLPPGNYQITAFLDGYEPFASGVTLVAGEPKALNLTLEPQGQSVRILTDFEKGTAALDGQPPVDLQDGQYLFEKVTPGSHTVKVASGTNEASFGFELANAKLPTISAPPAAKNVLAVLVSSFANQARVVTSSGAWKLTVNGQQEGDTGPNGLDLKSFQAGVDELVIGDGKNEYNVKENFGPAPMLTAKILRPEQNMGTLIVATGENDVTVFVNNKQYPRRTARGELRIPALGPKTVRVAKTGFEELPPQMADVKKGEDARLEFKMKPAAQFSSLEVVGGVSGTEVRLDQRTLGTLGPDGGFRNTSIPPGAHSIELVRPQFSTRSFNRTFTAGQLVTLSGLDVQMAEVKAATPAPPPPPEAPKPPPVAPKAAPQVARSLGMEGFDDPTQWKDDNGVLRHRGQGFFVYKVPPNGGVLTFNVYLIRGGGLLRGARLRWRVGYVDDKNFTQFELDDDTLYAKDVVNGKSTDRKVKHGIPSKDKKDKVWAIKIDLTPDKVVHQIQKEQEWVTIDSFSPMGRKVTDGKFGFWLQGGGDEMGLSDLSFRPH